MAGSITKVESSGSLKSKRRNHSSKSPTTSPKLRGGQNATWSRADIESQVGEVVLNDENQRGRRNAKASRKSAEPRRAASDPVKPDVTSDLLAWSLAYKHAAKEDKRASGLSQGVLSRRYRAMISPKTTRKTVTNNCDNNETVKSSVTISSPAQKLEKKKLSLSPGFLRRRQKLRVGKDAIGFLAL